MIFVFGEFSEKRCQWKSLFVVFFFVLISYLQPDMLITVAE